MFTDLLVKLAHAGLEVRQNAASVAAGADARVRPAADVERFRECCSAEPRVEVASGSHLATVVCRCHRKAAYPTLIRTHGKSLYALDEIWRDLQHGPWEDRVVDCLAAVFGRDAIQFG